MNSYLAPKVVSYLDGIETLWNQRGFKGVFSILNSAGGVLPVKEAAKKPVTLVTSGPNWRVMGSIKLAEKLGHNKYHHHGHGRHVVRCRNRRRWEAPDVDEP